MSEGMSPIGCGCSRRSDGRKGRNLVVNLDGTSNQYGTKNTNVIELFSRISASNEQLKYYNSGIGTYARPSWRSWNYAKQAMTNWVDLAIAWNFETVLIGAYRWLSDQYQEGDRIFLFGFSRGAYQVRALAGMIEKVGLIHRGNEEQIPFAYELYADLNVTNEKAAHFKKTFSVKNVRVHFIGVWDSVSSIGLVRGAELPLVGSCNHVCLFRHALALDECRVKFIPECIVKPGRPLPPNAKEVWFPGSHSDVGGGLLPNDELNLQSIPLLWMEREALFAGLHLQQSSIGSWEIRHLKLVPFDSLGRFSVWRILECLPIPRECPTDPLRLTWVPHLCEGRSILPGQKIHASIAFREDGYAPKASFYKPAASRKTSRDWGDIVGRGQAGQFRDIDGWDDILELDIFDTSVVPDLLDRLREEEFNEENRMSILDHLRFLSSLPDIDRSMRLRILQNMTVEELVKMLDTEDCVLAAETLSKLAYKVDARATIDMVGGIRILVRMLSGHNSRPAALVLQALMIHGESRAKIMAAGAIPLLVEMLETNECDAAAAVLCSLDGVQSEEFSRSDAIPRLLRMGRSGKWPLVAGALASLANNSDIRTRLILEQAPFALIPALKTETSKSHAADILAKLAQCDENSRETITQSMAIPLLVGMLQGHEFHPALEALRWLSAHPPARKQIIKEIANLDVIPQLVNTLNDPNNRKSAASILAWLAYDDRDALAKIIRSHAVLPFVDMLRNGDESTVAVEALKCLVWHDEGRAQFLQANAISLLAQALNLAEGRKHAAYTLACVAEKSPSHRKEILSHSTVIPTLVNMLGNAVELVAATEALRWLVQEDAGRRQIVYANATPILVSVLRTSKARVNTACILVGLARGDQHVQAQIVLCDAIPTLIHMLRSTSSDCAASIEALQVLSGSPDGRSQIIQNNVLPLFVHALGQGPARNHAAYLLARLANHGQRDQIVALHAVPALTLILNDANGHHRSALAAIQSLAYNADAQTELLRANAITRLVNLLDSGTDAAEGAAKVLAVLATNDNPRAAMTRYNTALKLGSMLGEKYHEAASAALFEFSKHSDTKYSVSAYSFGPNGALIVSPGEDEDDSEVAWEDALDSEQRHASTL